MPLPTSTRVLPLARKRELVPKLARALATVNERGGLPLMRLLEQAVALAHELEQAVSQMQAMEPAPDSPDRDLQRMLSASLDLGEVLRRARELS